MRPTGVHHVSINVDDVDAAIEFYVGKLGLKPRSDRPDFAFGGAWLDVGPSGGQVHLIEGDPPRPAGQHFAVRVDDLAAAVAELRAAGVAVTDPVPVATNLQAFLSDPAGNQVELHQVGGAPRAAEASSSAGV
jgi:catechol 2,3-dioxygenase-like lactoylglutathione lyase family enzyme